MTTEVIPTIAIHEVTTGNLFDGEIPNVDGTDEVLFRGRVQEWLNDTQGGEFSAPDNCGMRIEQVHWVLDCAAAPDVSIFVVDDGDSEYLVHTVNALSGSYVQTNGGILVPPSFKLRVKSSVNMDVVTAVIAENTGVTGDGVTATYAITLATRPIDPTSLSLVAGTVTFTDVAGVLTGAGGGGGTGTINYTTGAISITLNTPASFNAVDALATYDRLAIGRVMVVQGQGWGQPAPSKVNTIGLENMPPSMERA